MAEEQSSIEDELGPEQKPVQPSAPVISTISTFSHDVGADSKAVVALIQPKEETAMHLHGYNDGSVSPSSSTCALALNMAEERGSLNRDIILLKLNEERTRSLIRAWEENSKAKSVNRVNRKLSKISAWETSKKASAEAKLKLAEERIENKRVAYVEKMRNAIASVEKRAEEERALARALHGEELLRVEEKSAKYRASGKTPNRLFLCFGH